MNRSVAWRSGVLQALMVAALAVVLGVTLPRSFFEDWGWLAGPATWAGCALVVAVVLRLPPVPVLAGAALAGIPMLAGVAVGIHWLGAPVALLLLGLWCGRLAGGPVTA